MWPYLLVWDDIIWLMQSYYSFADDCYYGAFENFESLGDYAHWVDNPSQIEANSKLNFGFIYTVMRELLGAMFGSERSFIETNYDLGLAIGQIYYFMIISEYFYEVIQTYSLDITFTLVAPPDERADSFNPVG